jgi:large subunit ribosomal protein L4
MTIDLFSAAGQKLKSLHLPTTLFTGEVNTGLMHQAVLLQQSNRRRPIAHAKTRGEVVGSTRKLFQQKGTGRARRGPVRSPVMRGGGKAFGPRSIQNYTLRMPKAMRHAALRSCLSAQQKHGSIVALESFGTEVKTKTLALLLQKLPLKNARRVLIVWGDSNRALTLSARNLTNTKTLSAAYLNPEDVLNATSIVFLVDALEVADRVFGKKAKESDEVVADATEEKAAPAKKTVKKPAAKKPAAKKTSRSAA